MLKLQARIFEVQKTAINGVTLTVPQMAVAVSAFNANANSGMVTFDNYPGNQNVNLDTGAGTAFLHMEGDDVIATVRVLKTPMGNIAAELVDSKCRIHIMPVTSADYQSGELKLRIRHLVIPPNPDSPFAHETPLMQVQNWVHGPKHWPMYELKEHK